MNIQPDRYFSWIEGNQNFFGRISSNQGSNEDDRLPLDCQKSKTDNIYQKQPKRNNLK